MAKDVKVKLTLDLANARADLAQFYGLLRSAPPIAPRGMGAGQGQQPSTSQIAGGVAIGNLLAGGLRAGWNAPGFRQAREAVLEEFKHRQLGIDMPVVAGAFASREDVASRYGKLYGMGIVDLPFMRQMQGLSDQFGAGMQARGEAMARRDLGIETMKGVAEEIGKIIAYEAASGIVKGVLAAVAGRAL